MDTFRLVWNTCPIPGSIRGQVAEDLEQPGLVEGSQGVEQDEFYGPNQTRLSFCDLCDTQRPYTKLTFLKR